VPRASADAGVSIAPMLSVRRGADAVAFYKAAFGASELFKIENGGAVVAQLAVHGAKFWVADESPPHQNFSPQTLGGATARFVFVVDDPAALHARALAAGAKEVRPVHEEYGWLMGRVVDPFGHHWEIGKPLGPGVGE
jgi:PhnB protein